MLILENADGTPIQSLGTAFNLKPELRYNEVSTIRFDLPRYVDGVETANYNDVDGMRIINMVGWGRFILVDPEIESDGAKEIKHCTAYSLEFELTYKQIGFAEGLYKFWDPLSPTNTVLGIILEYLPSWRIGRVDDALIGKYRWFEATADNVYNFAKSTLQEMYGCIFDFDTYTREIHVRDINSVETTKPVYISLGNLAREIEISEDTQSIVTSLDVNGGEDLTIMSVNPMGNNKIYNLDYFMDTAHFSQTIVDKWTAWKSVFEANQKLYYDLSVRLSLTESAILAENAALTDMTNVDLAKLDNERSVYVAHLAGLTDTTTQEYAHFQALLDDVNQRIAAENSDIADKKDDIADLEQERDGIIAQLQAVHDSVQFDSFAGANSFTEQEILILDRYFKEDSITESSFVVSEVDSYDEPDTNNKMRAMTVSITGAKVIRTQGPSGFIYDVTGGSISITGTEDTDGAATYMTVSADLVKAVLQDRGGGAYVMSAYVAAGTITDDGVTHSFAKGTATAVGTFTNIQSDVAPTVLDGDTYYEGTSVTLTATGSQLYFTRNVTAYERKSVAWDLYDFGVATLRSLAYPSYSFSVSSGNFFSLEEFLFFVRQIELGERLYLDLDHTIVQPFLIGVDLDFEDPTYLKLYFGDKYCADGGEMKLADLLEQGVSMGKTVDANRLSFSSFVNSGASTAVRDFMQSALDVAKNSVLSSSGQGVAWDGSGLHLRKYVDDQDPDAGYDPEQIWMINNMIVFTDDGWSTAKMAIGKIIDQNIPYYYPTEDTEFNSAKTYYERTQNGTYIVWHGTAQDWPTRPQLYEKGGNGSAYGIVAPYLVGTMLVGENLVINSTKFGSPSNEQMYFTVDGQGARIANGVFDLYDSLDHKQISLNPELGILAGDLDTAIATDQYGNPTGVNTTGGRVATTISGLVSGDEPEANFWIDLDGNVYMRGKIIAQSGEIGGYTAESGYLHSGSGANYVALNGGTDVYPLYAMWAGAENPANASFWVKKDGSMKATNAIFSGTITGTIEAEPNTELIGAAIYVPTKENPKFYVDSSGNVSMTGSITWGSDNNPVSFESVNAVFDWMYRNQDGTHPTTIDGTYIWSPEILGGNFYGSNFYASSGSGYAQMDSRGMNVYTVDQNDVATRRIGMGYYDDTSVSYPYISLGIGSGSAASGYGVFMKYGNGVWVGDSSVVSAPGNYPGGGSTLNLDISANFPHATGVFIDFNDDEIYKFINGVGVEIGSGGSGSRASVEINTINSTIVVEPEGGAMPYVISYVEAANGDLTLTWPDGESFTVTTV